MCRGVAEGNTVKKVVGLLGAGFNCEALQQKVKNALGFIWPLPQHMLEQ